MFWKKFGQAQSANKLFNQASDHWRRRQQFLLQKDEANAEQSCLEVIRLCQLSIQSDEKMGDAYVLLSNALSVAAAHSPGSSDLERYDFLQSRAAAIIHYWYCLPHRGYPITKNAAHGERLWEILVDEVRRDRSLPSKDATVALMESYRDSLATETISANSFDKVGAVVLRTTQAQITATTPEEPSEQEALDSKVEDDRSNGAAEKNRIEEYDRDLLGDIERLKKHILKEEDTQREFMRSYGTPEETVEEVVRKARNEGRPIAMFGSSSDILRIQTFLAEMVPVYKIFPFRVRTRRIELFQPTTTNVITEDDRLILDTRPLDSEERREYAKQWRATSALNYVPNPPNRFPWFKWYPSRELMTFVANMLVKYGTSVLTKDEYWDANMNDTWKDASDEGQA